MSRRKPLPTTHRLGKGPDFANSCRFRSAPFQRRRYRQPPQPPPRPRRRPGNRSTSPRFHACRAVAWRRRVHSATPSQIVEDRLPRRHERVSFRQVPSAGRPRIRAFSKLPPSHRPQYHSDLCRSRRAGGLTPARHPLGGTPPRLTATIAIATTSMPSSPRRRRQTTHRHRPAVIISCRHYQRLPLADEHDQFFAAGTILQLPHSPAGHRGRTCKNRRGRTGQMDPLAPPLCGTI